jgi:hypothetical protein
MPEASFGPPEPDGAARLPAFLRGSASARLAAVSPFDCYRPRPAAEDLRIPQQVRRSWALDDLDQF